MTTKAIHGARILLGVIFTGFGLNGFFHFLPLLPMSGPPEHFLGALIVTGYLFPLLKATEVLAGTLLLSDRLVPLALTLLAPVVVNLVAFPSVPRSVRSPAARPRLDPGGLSGARLLECLRGAPARAYFAGQREGVGGWACRRGAARPQHAAEFGGINSPYAFFSG